MSSLSFTAWLAASMAASSPLASFQDYVGHCWITAIDQDVADRHCFETVFGGAHVRDRHVVTRGGQSIYAGETLYSAEGGRIGFTYWNSLGGVGHGEADAENGGLAFRLSMRATPDALPQEMRTIWRTTAQGYDTTTDGVTRHFRRDDMDMPASHR